MRRRWAPVALDLGRKARPFACLFPLAAHRSSRFLGRARSPRVWARFQTFTIGFLCALGEGGAPE